MVQKVAERESEPPALGLILDASPQRNDLPPVITASPSHAHWSFFTAIESDTETLLRFVEPSPSNFNTYSLEICRVLFAASSECEVVLKEIARVFGQDTPDRMNMNQLRESLKPHVGGIVAEKVFVGRYGLELLPWSNWAEDTNPDWWTGYNKVKHARLQHYQEGSLINALNAVAGLMVVTLMYYRLKFGSIKMPLTFTDTLKRLSPQSRLFSVELILMGLMER